MLRLQRDPGFDCFYFIADWHMLTTHYDRTDELAAWTEGLVLDWLAAGIDPSTSTIYRQSDIPEVAENLDVLPVWRFRRFEQLHLRIGELLLLVKHPAEAIQVRRVRTIVFRVEHAGVFQFFKILFKPEPLGRRFPHRIGKEK
jgi:hypothetical protein